MSFASGPGSYGLPCFLDIRGVYVDGVPATVLTQSNRYAWLPEEEGLNGGLVFFQLFSACFDVFLKAYSRSRRRLVSCSSCRIPPLFKPTLLCCVKRRALVKSSDIFPDLFLSAIFWVFYRSASFFPSNSIRVGFVPP